MLLDDEAMLTTDEQGIEEIQQHLSEVNEICKGLGAVIHDQGVPAGIPFKLRV